MDGESTIALAKPTIYGDEKRTLKINVIQIKRNLVERKAPQPNFSYRTRLGTTSAKLADGQNQSTAPIETLRAIAAIVTAPSQRAVGNASLFSYTPATASIIASIATFPTATGVFNLVTNYVAPVTATITGSFASTTPSTITIPLANTKTGLADAFGIEGVYQPLFSGNELNSPVTATFTATMLAGQIVKIEITNKGLGYPSGTYALTFGGAATASVTATTNAVASNDFIQSVSITNAGSGYPGTPSVTLFGPAKKLNATGDVYINLGAKGVSTAAFSLTYSEPDAPLTPPASVKPTGTIAYTGNGTIWKFSVTSAGYGYSSAPTVSHNEILGYLPFATIVTRPPQGGFSNYDQVGGGLVNLLGYAVSVGFSTEPVPINFGGIRTESSFSPTLAWAFQKGQRQNLQVIGNISNFKNAQYEELAGLEKGSVAIAALLNSVGVVVTGSQFGPPNLLWRPGQGSLPSSGNITLAAFNEYRDRGTKYVS